MASVQGNYAGDITRIYYVPTVIADKTEANIEAALIEANRVGDVTEIGEVTAEATNIEFAIAGEELSSPNTPNTVSYTHLTLPTTPYV